MSRKERYYVVEHVNHHRVGRSGDHYTIEDREPFITEEDMLPTPHARRLVGTYESLEDARASIPEHFEAEEVGLHALPWIVAEYRHDGSEDA